MEGKEKSAVHDEYKTLYFLNTYIKGTKNNNKQHNSTKIALDLTYLKDLNSLQKEDNAREQCIAMRNRAIHVRKWGKHIGIVADVEL